MLYRRFHGVSLSFDPNRLDIRKFANTEGAELTPKARLLHPAEWNAWVRRHHFVDEDHPGIEPFDKFFLLLFVFGPTAGAQSKTCVVGNANCIRRVLHAKDGSYRAKELFAVGRRIARNICQNRGRIIAAWTGQGPAPQQQPRAGIDAFLNSLL